MKKLLVVLGLAALAAQETVAQELERRPAQISVVPGIGTNGTAGKKIYQPFSFNILAGLNGGVNGFELGGILNIDTEFARGVQVAGVSNLVGGETEGVQLAGVVNANKGDSKAWQMAGVANLNKGGSGNSQWAGVVNVAGGNSTGSQLGGVANVVKGDMQGLQAAGVVNVATGNVDGAQFSGVINQARSIRGAQIGVINLAGSSKGLQLGVINIADSATTTVGLINIVRRNGYYRGEVWAGETFYANAAFKMGTRRFYSLLAAGWRQKDKTYQLGYGFGIGSELMSRDKAALSLDLIAYQLAENELWTKEGTNNLYQARLSWARQVSGNTAFLIGATFNVFNSTFQSNGADGSIGMDITPWNIYSEVHGGRRITMWTGINVGFRF